MPTCQHEQAQAPVTDIGAVVMASCERDATHHVLLITEHDAVADINLYMCAQHANALDSETAPEERSLVTITTLSVTWCAAYDRAVSDASHVTMNDLDADHVRIRGIEAVMDLFPPNSPVRPGMGFAEDQIEDFEAGYLTGWCAGVIELAAHTFRQPLPHSWKVRTP